MKFGRYILATAAAVLGLSGCLRDDFAECPAVPGGETLVSVSMNVPGAEAGTRAVVSETQINTLDVVVFRSTDPTDTNTIFYKLVQLGAGDITLEGAYCTFKIGMPRSDADTYRFVLLANLRNEVNAKDLPTTKPGKQGLLSGLGFRSLYVDPLENRYLPMWGETEELHAITSTTSIPTVQMIRSVARVEVKVADDLMYILAPGAFRVPYQYDDGRVAPLAANYHKGSRKVTAPSLYGTNMLSPVMSTSDPGEIIYMTEYDSTAAAEYCILLHASYNGGERTWYKIYLRDKSGQPVDILRNHSYTVTITKVTGPGYSSPEDALASNIYLQAEVAEWNDARQSVVIEGNHYLNISHPGLALYADAGWVEVTFETNFPGAGNKSGVGYNFAEGVTWRWVGSQPLWLNAMPTLSEPYKKVVRLAWSVTTLPHSAAIKVTAGNMNYILNITKSADPWLVATPEPLSMLDGMFHSMGVASDCSWSAAFSGAPDAVAAVTPVTTTSQESRNCLYYTTDAASVVANMSTVTVTFSSPEYNYTPATAVITLGRY